MQLEVERVRALVKARRFGEAIAAATRLAGEVPENRDVLYLRAQRQAHRPADVLATLARRELHDPRYSRLYKKRGHCCVALKGAPRGIGDARARYRS